jgi:MOSC domain-containing protein YiiM
MSCDECGFDPTDWEPRDGQRILRHADRWLEEIGPGSIPDTADLHDVQHTMWRAGRERWSGTPTRHGQVERLHTSGGGVPKTAVPQAICGRRGFAGDRCDDRDNHGSPLQALCLWSAEVIEALQDEGHPIGPGLAGENLTVRGLDWAEQVAPGQRWTIGPVRVETTAWAVPCSKNARWFAGGDFRRMSQPLHPGWSRIYARVLRPGEISVGDQVSVEPDEAGWVA